MKLPESNHFPYENSPDPTVTGAMPPCPSRASWCLLWSKAKAAFFTPKSFADGVMNNGLGMVGFVKEVRYTEISQGLLVQMSLVNDSWGYWPLVTIFLVIFGE